LQSRKTRRVALLLAIASVAALAPATAEAGKRAKPDVKFMSRNLYLGADIIKMAVAKNEAEERALAAQLHETVRATDFNTRAQALAGEVANRKPDVIGLQEVARYLRSPDGQQDEIKNANMPLYNWLSIFQRELRARDMHYRVVSKLTWIDVEVSSDEGYDLRFQQANVVLVRRGSKVKFLRQRKAVFPTQLPIPLHDQQVVQQRGWAGMEGRVAGKRFRFFTPHAEAYSNDVSTQQFKEMMASTQLKPKRMPMVIAGDFNSDPRSTDDAERGGYDAVVDAGFRNTAPRPRNTCCQSERLDNDVSELETWIDHIMVRPRARVLGWGLVGNEPADRVNDLWPSDHAGIFARLRLK
jgi:endonuclease/exonuclease/phosphatase family metal-dependent hydrolase